MEIIIVLLVVAALGYFVYTRVQKSRSKDTTTGTSGGSASDSVIDNHESLK